MVGWGAYTFSASEGGMTKEVKKNTAIEQPCTTFISSDVFTYSNFLIIKQFFVYSGL